jgi:opacity protein-like surface antigen
MKKFILLCFSICTASYIFSQDNVSVHYAQTFSTFNYTDSQGNSSLKMRSRSRSAYGVNFSKVFNSGFFVRPEIGFKNLGAVSELYNEKLDWSLRYIDFNLGFGLVKQFRSVAPFIGVSPYVSYLYNATQTVGSDEYDLLVSDGIKKNDYGFNLFGGVKYLFTEAVSVFVEARTTTGLMQLEPNTEAGKNQKLYNRAVAFHFGISFNMVNKKRARFRSNF